MWLSVTSHGIAVNNPGLNMRIIYDAITVAGKYKDQNQDNIFINGKRKESLNDEFFLTGETSTEYQLFAVGDGMGGAEAGATASFMLFEKLSHCFRGDRKFDYTTYINEINNEIYEYQVNSEVTMGTTLACVYLEKDRLFAINIGDTRIYLVQQSDISLVSKDDNEYQLAIDMGIKVHKKEEKKLKCRLTQYIGLPDEEIGIEPHILEKKAKIGDQILLCSDGVSSVLSDTQILECVQKCKKEAKNVCRCLVEEAIKCGSSDNLTVMYLYIEED